MAKGKHVIVIALNVNMTIALWKAYLQKNEKQ